MDIDKEFDQIMSKYSKCNINETFCLAIKEKMIEILKTAAGKKVLVRGAGRHTEQLLKFLQNNNISISIQALVDNKMAGLTWNNIPIIAVENINEYEYDSVIISSYKYRHDMKEDFLNMKDVQIIDIYDYLHKNNLYINKQYYCYKLGGYEPVIYQIEQYHKNKSSVNLENVIFSTLTIKDFLHGFKYIDEYIQNQYDDGSIRQLKNELIDLFRKIYNEFQKRKNKRDIVSFVLDSVPQKNIEWLPNIYSKIENGMYFTKAYTTCPYTTQSIRSLLNEELHMDNYDFYRENLSLNEGNCELISYLRNCGYEFKYIVVDGVNCFNEQNYNISEETTCGIIIWKGIKEILISDKPIVCFIHPANETHYPNVSLYSAGKDWDTYSINDIIRHQQHMESYKYVDQMIAFYEKFMPEVIKIFMSDHGEHFVSPQFHFAEDKLSTILLIEGPGIKKQKEDSVFSWLEFPKLIKYLISKDDDWLKKMNRKYALFQDIDFYNETWINNAIVRGQAKYGMAFRGLVTNHDKYVLLRDGTEVYYINGDEKHNLINKKEYAERITKLRNIVGNEFLDYNNYEELSKSYKLYL